MSSRRGRTRARERERERQRQTDRQTDRQRDRQTGRQAGRQAGRGTEAAAVARQDLDRERLDLDNQISIWPTVRDWGGKGLTGRGRATLAADWCAMRGRPEAATARP